MRSLWSFLPAFDKALSYGVTTFVIYWSCLMKHITLCYILLKLYIFFFGSWLGLQINQIDLYFSVYLNYNEYEALPIVKQKHLQSCCFDKNNVFLLCFGWGATNCITYIFLFILFIGVLKYSTYTLSLCWQIHKNVFANTISRQFYTQWIKEKSAKKPVMIFLYIYKLKCGKKGTQENKNKSLFIVIVR